MRSTIATGPVRLLLLVAALSALPLARAAAQPDPTPAAKVHVESTAVNLTATPRFSFAVSIPTMLAFQTFDSVGHRFLEIYAISRVDSLDARIKRAASYLGSHQGIFTPLIEPPNRGMPIIGYVDRAEFERALRAALRPPGYTYTLNYKRLT
jgi:hypothetical protein